MKRIRVIVIAVCIIAAILLSAHLVINTNWPEFLRSIHGR
jgi:hypothetical protein